ncbi:hypothetical protein CC1G_06151 [Coprinopsis cinerea okayama7|uniref:DUF6697 domain-containing protein n=1 Tax=Coprinopsis cinerea (strain Okayama-7 / 130 / ATCC MYA-4618 / FGSC 9003) TaxID=240176 RepID=D6RL04_COPC7|nr:hypothetical protein CC1G_06151 [Coprinopsis cinerea okayama7\|eukprot:XP_002911976.1 hypothetical protein CC1G_06151 [Coprinopsis cinerea okayama7\
MSTPFTRELGLKTANNPEGDNVEGPTVDQLIGRLRNLETLSPTAGPFRVVEMALEIQVERMRVVEVLRARDAAVERLSDAYSLVRRYSELIERLQEERVASGLERLSLGGSGPAYDTGGSTAVLDTTAHIASLEATIKDLREINSPNLAAASGDIARILEWSTSLPETRVSVLPFPLTSEHSWKHRLGGYRTLQSATAAWCPEREEHGFMYVPMFKCNTNPRTVTAHRWNAVDPIGRMAKPTECFYNNEGTWYYAGIYRAFVMDIVSTAEWEFLTSETKTAIIKETLAARKNTTPQTNYETGQLYAAGALKLACVGLQCVGFSQEVYQVVSELSTRLLQSTAAAAAAVAASSSSKTPSESPNLMASTTPGSLPKSKFLSSPQFNPFIVTKGKAGSSFSTTSTSGFNLASPGSTSGTPPMTSNNHNDFTGCNMAGADLASGGLGLSHSIHSSGGSSTYNNRLLPTANLAPGSKSSSPLSTSSNASAIGGPCTPSLAPQMTPTPGISPIGRPLPSTTTNITVSGTNSVGSLPAHSGIPSLGLGSGSPIWNSALGTGFSSYLNSLNRPGGFAAKGSNTENAKVAGGSDGLGFGNRMK